MSAVVARAIMIHTAPRKATAARSKATSQPRPFADARGEDEIGEEAQQDGEDQPLMLAQVARAAGEAGPESGAFVAGGGHLVCA